MSKNSIVYCVSALLVICVPSWAQTIIKLRPTGGNQRQAIALLVRNPTNFFQAPLKIPDMPVNAGQLRTSLHPPRQELFDFYIPFHAPANAPVRQNEATVAMMPPMVSKEPNYYSMKPKKYPKKYSAHKNYGQQGLNDANRGSTKFVKNRGEQAHKDQPELSQQPKRLVFDNAYFEAAEPGVQVPEATMHNQAYAKKSRYNLGEVPPVNESQEESASDDNEAEAAEDGTEQEDDEEPKEKKRDRIEYQMHGHDGPKSYKFGFDTGKGKDRQFRYEIRDKEGHVKGQYGYLDTDGKMILVKYTSTPEEGFKVENDH